MPETLTPPAASALRVADIRSPAFREMQQAAYGRDLERLHRQLGDFVAVACPACGATHHTPAFEKYRCRFVHCDDCRTLYMSPRPTPAVMNDYYSHSENYRIWAEHIFPASEARRRDSLCRPLLDAILGACARHGISPGHMLEIGPGFGTFAELALASGSFQRVSVVERTPEMAAACRRRGLEVHESAAEDLPAAQTASADVLAFFEVIEHVFDPSAFLRAGLRLLRPGGLLVLTCPNGDGFDTRLLGPRSVAVDTEHVNLFNPRSIALLLEGLGLEVLETTTPGRLDCELVREAVDDGSFSLDAQPFLRQVLVDEADRLAAPFQRFLADNGLSGHLRVFARKR